MSVFSYIYLNSFSAGSRTEAVSIEAVGQEWLDQGPGELKPSACGFDVVAVKARDRFNP